MNRLLIVKLADLGDVLTATPALRALRRAHPSARIDVLTTPAGRTALEGSTLVDEVLIFPKSRFDRPADALRPSALALAAGLARRLRAGRYDAVAVMHHLTTPFGAAKYAALAAATGAPVRAGLDNGRGWFLTHRAPDPGFGERHEVEYAEAVAALLGAAPDGGPLERPVSVEDRTFAAAALPDEGRPTAAIHPGSGAFSPARRWPAERFGRVAAMLARRGVRIVIVGGPDETGMAADVAGDLAPAPVNLAGRTTVGQLAAVLARCDVFIGSDSGVMHLAAAAGAPVAAIFGPSNSRAWGPWPGPGGEDRVRVLRMELRCSPCIYVGRSLGTPQGCPARTCLAGVGPAQVAAAAEELMRLRRSDIRA